MLTWFAVFGSLFGSAIALFAAVLATRASLRTHELAVDSAQHQAYQAESEELMRNLRWGVELAVTDQRHSASAGAVVLGALVNAGLGDETDHEFVKEVVRGVIDKVSDHARYASDNSHEDPVPEGGADA